MFRKSLCLFALAVASMTTASNAQESGDRLVLMAGLCEETAQQMQEWSTTVSANAAFAVPVSPFWVRQTCDDSGPRIPAAHSWSAATPEEARRLAVAACEETLPDGYRRCGVIAELRAPR